MHFNRSFYVAIILHISNIFLISDVQVEIETDKGKIGQKRAIMIEGGKEKSLVSFRKTYTKDKKNCTTLTIYVQVCCLKFIRITIHAI